MKKLLILCLLIFSIQVFSQVIPVLSCKVTDLITPFGQNLSKGTEVFVLSDSTKHIVVQPVVSTETMTTAASSFISSVTKIIGVLPIAATGTNGKVTISIAPATTSTAGSLSAADKVRVDSIPLLERKSNKVITISGSSTDIQYPSAKLLYDQLATKEPIITSGTTGQYWRGDKTWQTLPSGTGTVTSITGGIGITGGTITDSGTLAIDTAIVAKKTTVAAMYQPKGSYLVAADITGKVDKEAGKHLPDNNYTDADSTKVAGLPNLSVQPLSGTTLSFNALNGVSGTLTISGNTTLTLSNLTAGWSGNIRITNPSTAYTITFSGYTNIIAPTIYTSTNTITCSGGSKKDVISWWYDGTYLNWAGTKDLK